MIETLRKNMDFLIKQFLICGIKCLWRYKLSLKISNEFVIHTGIQRDGSVITASVNTAKPSGKELDKIFHVHIGESALVLTDGLLSYRVLETLADCTVVDINHEESHRVFNLNTVSQQLTFVC